MYGMKQIFLVIKELIMRDAINVWNNECMWTRRLYNADDEVLSKKS